MNDYFENSNNIINQNRKMIWYFLLYAHGCHVETVSWVRHMHGTHMNSLSRTCFPWSQHTLSHQFSKTNENLLCTHFVHELLTSFFRFGFTLFFFDMFMEEGVRQQTIQCNQNWKINFYLIKILLWKIKMLQIIFRYRRYFTCMCTKPEQFQLDKRLRVYTNPAAYMNDFK